MTRRPEASWTKDWEAYHALVARAVDEAHTVVEVGCGDGAVAPFPWRLYPHVRLWGVDPDPAARNHPWAEAVHQPTASGRWPLEDRCADLVLARYVFEHVERPRAFLREAARVLRPGGRLLFLTPNARHPAALASRALPTSWKRRILQATRGVDEDDVFPTWYRLNTPGALRRALGPAGFAEIRLTTRELEPCPYLAFCRPGAWLARAYYEALRRTGMEGLLGASILGEASLPADQVRSANTGA
ncbi:MAG: methyltransferase domain-containing protein [Acidobacteria bacterium]|nr:methyltransferase domain-containing protein [Acidobacteriota bacterium]